MKRITTILVTSIVLGGLAVGLFFSNRSNRPFSLPAADTAAQVVATINGETITYDMLEAEINISRLNVLNPSPPLQGADLTTATEEAISQLITRHLVLQAAARQNFSLDDAFIQKRVELLFGSYGDEALDNALRQSGSTRADLFWWVSEMTTAEEFVVQVVMANAKPEMRQQVYSDWLNDQQATADIKIYSGNAARTFTAVVGKPAPNFTLTNLDGRQISLSDYRGKVILLNFWATWCPACASAMPEQEQIYRRYSQTGGDFIVLGVNLQENPAWVRQFVDKLGITFPILLDEDGSITNRQYQAPGIPTSFLIDRQGVIFYRHIGPMSGEILIAKLKELGF